MIKNAADRSFGMARVNRALATSRSNPLRLTDRPVELCFSFERRQSRVGATASVLTHVALAAVFFWAVRYAPQPDFSQFEPARPLKDIVWLNVPGPGGGGGGGNRQPDPPRKAELPGRQPITVPAQEPPAPTPSEEPPIESLTIPAVNSAAAEQALLGAIDSTLAGPPESLGRGRGSGVGPGQGSGYGPGFGGGIGGGAYRPGAGITLPRVLKEVKPAYTADAMRAKVQGSVWLECIVLPDGTVGDVRVTRSLDPIFGLDQEAIKAAKAWRFVPGTRLGQPVPVIVTIELTFTLR